jgi:hypothetical protein
MLTFEDRVLELLKGDLSVRAENKHCISCMGGNTSQLFHLMTNNVEIKIDDKYFSPINVYNIGAKIRILLPKSVKEMPALSETIMAETITDRDKYFLMSDFFKELREALNTYCNNTGIKSVSQEQLTDVNFLSEYNNFSDIKDLISCCNKCNEINTLLSPYAEEVALLYKEFDKKYDLIEPKIKELIPSLNENLFKPLVESKSYNALLSGRVLIGLEKVVQFGLDIYLDPITSRIPSEPEKRR